MGQQQSGFVVEVASPRLGRFQALPQKEPEDDGVDTGLCESPTQQAAREWRITTNPAAELFGTERLRALIHRLYHQRKLFTEQDAKLVLAALYALDPSADLLLPLLTVVSNATAHHANQALMRDARITERIAEMASSRCAAGSRAARVMLLQCLANMAVARENHAILRRCTPNVMHRLSSTDEVEAAVAMQALTNLSLDIQPDQVSMLSDCVPLLLSRLWRRGEPCLDVLRLLVNLCCCPDMVPHVLGAKAVTGVLGILDSDKTEVLMRCVTWILCMSSAVDALQLGYEKLAAFNRDPFGNPSHTLFHSIFGAKAREHLEKRAAELTKHPQREISTKSGRLLDILSQIPMPPAVGFHLNRL